MNIPLGYEVADPARGIAGGRAVSVPAKHLCVTGQTQESGKTTTLEALITRSGFRAVAFITKRGEKSFRLSRMIPPYYRESTTGEFWEYVQSIVEGMLDVKLGWQERGMLIKLCQDYEKSAPASAKKKSTLYEWRAPKSLRDLLKNITVAKPFQRGNAEVVAMQLATYLTKIIPEIESTRFVDKLDLQAGVPNVMDISHLTETLQALVIRATVEWVHKHGRKTVVIIPEAWKFIPRKTTPVKQAVERLIREGAVLQNFVWLDSQDLRGVDPLLLRSIGVWIFGVQRERNEVANTLESIPDLPKPAAKDIMQLKKGEFFAAYGDTCIKTYVRPAGMGEEHARAIARGEETADSWKRIVQELDSEQDAREMQEMEEANGEAREAVADANHFLAANGHPAIVPVPAHIQEEEDEMWKERAEKAEREIEQLKAQIESLTMDVKTLEGNRERESIRSVDSVPSNGVVSLDSLWPEIVRRLKADKVLLQCAYSQPEITVAVSRRTIEMSGEKLPGQIARLLHRGFFKTPQKFDAIRAELIRVGAMDKKSGNAPVGNVLNSLNEWGFLTQEEAGWQEVPGMKTRIVES